VMYGERYMDTPEENPDGYLAANLSTEVENLKGKLLMIHGGIDPVVVQQHSLVFVQECIKKQIPIDYFVYPRAEHNVRGYDRIHLMNKVTDYFNDYLK
jgi:dipeptidyl-peptidase 4